ncbi:alpha-1D adrenergic receptor [Aethina tumida]|uniref:alpha-1D adrenergic receptor n=1 Tax=Aethina tumida TaxID=116153 RepID=UPI0021496FA8|nr:alpha-1D adrenergic receptor [Aethina tumida]XP_049824713.1 alpha-1D adrenergic receptor [Aethina tumida]XP_049824714.1 alpha-1D adrenergic receptor [Aethina tumida]XP_049824715.1 alpha-1D adrenergic receptor [Aethina tumida]
MESDYHWLVTAALVASSVIAITANLFLLLVICRRRGLRTVPNRFIINLLVTNLLSSILLIPLLLTDQGLNLVSNTTSITNSSELLIISDDYREEVLEKNVVEEIVVDNSCDRIFLCYFAQSSTNFVCTASIFSILLIGVNHYFGVIHSLRYHFYINRCRSTIFIITSWVIALLCSVLSTVTYSDSMWSFCHKTRQLSEPMRVINTVYAFTYFIVVILAPFAAICLIYYCIYKAAHRNSERMRKSTSSSANLDYIQVPSPYTDLTERTLPKVHSAPNFTHLVKQSSFIECETQNANKVQRTVSERNTNNFINTLKHKISNASVFRYREETRAAKISLLVIFMVLVCYVPYGITLVLSCEYVQVKPGQIFNYISLILLVVSNVVSPFLFGYRNKRIKREIGKIFGFVQSSNVNRISVVERQRRPNIIRNRSFEEIHENYDQSPISEPFLVKNRPIPEVVVTCKPENERKSILKKYTSSWSSYKKCNFITVPESCISGEARGSFSSASTQISNEE